MSLTLEQAIVAMVADGKSCKSPYYQPMRWFGPERRFEYSPDSGVHWFPAPNDCFVLCSHVWWELFGPSVEPKEAELPVCPGYYVARAERVKVEEGGTLVFRDHDGSIWGCGWAGTRLGWAYGYWWCEEWIWRIGSSAWRVNKQEALLTNDLDRASPGLAPISPQAVRYWIGEQK